MTSAIERDPMIVSLTPSFPRRRRLGVAVACAAGNVFGMSTIIFSTFPMFFVPVTTELGWSPAEFSFTLMIIAVIDFVAYPLGGMLMDRFGARPVILIGNVLLGLSIMALSTMSSSRAYSYALIALVGSFAALPSTVLLSRVISSWFRENRATALAIASGLAFGVGAAVNPLIAQFVIEHAGWRTAYLVLGALPIFIVNPVMLLFLWQPQAERMGASTGEASETDATLALAARTRQFWLLLFSAALAPGAVAAITSHAVVILASNQVGATAAAAMISSAAITSAVWQLALGRIIDKTSNPRIAGLFLVVAAAGAVLVAKATTGPQAIAAGIMLGVGAGTEYALLPYAVSLYFGLRDYGAIYGSIFGAVSLVIGAAALAMDLAFGLAGNWLVPSICCGGILCFCAVCLFLLPPFRSEGVASAAI